jgi:hypothetical protein
MTSAAPKDCSDRQGVILVAIDGSTTSLHAEAWAANLARKQGCRLLCLFVETHAAYADAALWTGAALPPGCGPGELAKEILEGIRDDLKAYPVHADFLVRSGDPATEIERVAEDASGREAASGSHWVAAEKHLPAAPKAENPPRNGRTQRAAGCTPPDFV